VVDHSEESNLESLSPRELEVLGYLARGYTNRQIAETLYISTRTVESHRANIMGKLGIKNRIELVEYAKKYGLMDQ
jgi:two-component system, NarL family, response regulator NreC